MLKSQRHGLRRGLVHPGDAADRVLLKGVVPDRQTEGEAEDRSRLLGRAVTLGGRELLDELVDLAHIDLAERVGLEGRHYKLAHVALVERTCARRKLVGEIEICEPHLDKTTERTVARQVSAAGGKAITTRELQLECALGRLARASRCLDESKLSIVIASSSDSMTPDMCAPTGTRSPIVHKVLKSVTVSPSQRSLRVRERLRKATQAEPSQAPFGKSFAPN